MRNLTTIILLFLLFLSVPTDSESQMQGLSLDSLKGSNQILVLGESYGQDESTIFFTKIVTDYVDVGGCLNVGLEIPSDQQDVLDKSMRGEISISDIQIDNVIDHDAYREMLVNFSEEIISGKCLSVYAIGKPGSIPISKDAWMEQEVVKITEDKPLALLVGNKHAIKDFNTVNDDNRKLLTQRLRSRSFGVSSILQHWKPGYCEVKSVKLYKTTEKNKSKIYVKEAIGEISAEMPEKVSMVTDGVLVWSCKKMVVKDEQEIKNGSVISEKYSIDIESLDVVERDDEVLKKIKSGIKHQYPVVGMNMDEVREAMGEPNEVEKAGRIEQWIYECSDDDGFDYQCYILRFLDNSLVKYDDLE